MKRALSIASISIAALAGCYVLKGVAINPTKVYTHSPSTFAMDQPKFTAPDRAPGSWFPPGDRGVNWSPGIPGGIPTGLPIHTTLPAGTSSVVINQAISAAASQYASTGIIQVVKLQPGAYNTDSPIQLNRSGVVLRGSGPSTRLILQGSTLWHAVRMGIFWPQGAPVLASVVGDLPKGSVQVTVNNAAQFNPGDVIQIDQRDDTSYVIIGDGDMFKRCPGSNPPASSCRSVGQQALIVAKAGNVLTLGEPTHIAFGAAFGPEVFLTGTGQWGTQNVGLEDMYVSGGNNGNIGMLNVSYGWVKNVESDGNPATSGGRGTNGFHIGLSRCFRCEVRGSYVHHARSISPGGGAYGIVVTEQSSDVLIEDNVTVNLNKPIVMMSSGGGNVVAYNYADDALIGEGQAFVFQETSIDANHVSFSHHDLFEGNWSVNLGGDTTHGNSGWQTFFRNYAFGRNTNTPQYYQNIHGANATGWSRYYTYAGNVLAGPGATNLQNFPPIYEHTWNGTTQVGNAFAWAAFRVGNSASPSGGNDNGAALATIYRHGNYDYISNSVRWEPPEPNHLLPDSLYYTGRPNWWPVGAQWPWVTAEGSTKIACLPAKARHDGTSCGSGGPTPTPSPSATPTPTPSPGSTPTPTPTVPPPPPTPTPVPTATPPPTPTPTPIPTCPIGEQKAVVWPATSVTDQNTLLDQQEALGFRFLTATSTSRAIFVRVNCP